MRPVTVTTTDASGGATLSAPVPLNYLAQDFGVGLFIDVTGTVNYTVQVSMDDPWAVYATDYATNGVWLSSSDASVVAATADANSNIVIPVRGVRLRQNSGNGSARMIVVQQGPG